MTTRRIHTVGWPCFRRRVSRRVARFGPTEAIRPDNSRWFDAANVHVAPDGTRGSARDISWDLSFASAVDDSGPLYTFPRLVWHRELLPGAQIVPWPRIKVRGSFTIADRSLSIDAVGALARIYGHGNAERWCWLHADLGEGAVLEIVSATSRRPVLRKLPMIAMLQLRVPGQPDWPRRPLLSRTRLTDSGFRVTGRAARRRIRVDVELPSDRSIALAYADPDGATATCTNSERADVVVEVERWSRRWHTERRWELSGTAHAEIGRRP